MMSKTIHKWWVSLHAKGLNIMSKLILALFSMRFARSRSMWGICRAFWSALSLSLSQVHNFTILKLTFCYREANHAADVLSDSGSLAVPLLVKLQNSCNSLV